MIKKIDSEKCTTEHFQDKHGENWHLIDIEAREGFASSTVSQIKCAAGLNVCGERAKDIDKSNARVCCPLCKSKESWEHVLLHRKLKKIREDWINVMQKKSHETAKKVKASTHHQKIANETMKDVSEHFNGDRNSWTNQQVLRMKEIFRVVVVKVG